jgi:hypothetical protein
VEKMIIDVINVQKMRENVKKEEESQCTEKGSPLPLRT